MFDHQHFFTFSSADRHWPGLHALLNCSDNNTADQRRQNVINNPHITDCFFTQRLENFIQWNLDLTKCQGTGEIGLLYRGSFPYITL